METVYFFKKKSVEIQFFCETNNTKKPLKFIGNLIFWKEINYDV